MLCADIVGGEADLAHDRAVPAADDELDGGPDLVQFNTQVGQDLGRYAVALPHQAEQEVLGADVVVVEALSLFLGEGQDATRALCELVKPIRHSVYSGMFPNSR